jgi:hypothetical protein
LEILILFTVVLVNVRLYFEDLDSSPIRQELDANSGGGKTLSDDLVL